MTEPLDLDDAEAIASWIAPEMKRRGLYWIDRSELHSFPSADGPGVRAWQARIGSTNNSDQTEFVGPIMNELEFWQKARHIVLDFERDGSIGE